MAGSSRVTESADGAGAYRPRRGAQRPPLPWPHHVAVALAAATPFVQMTMLGASSQFLQAFVPPMNFALCLILVILLRPDIAFWRRAAVVIGLLLAALSWAVTPELLQGLIPPDLAPRSSPDLLAANALRLLAGIAALVSGAIIGYRRGAVAAAAPWLLLFGALNLMLGLAARAVDPNHVWGFDKSIHQARFTGTLLNGNAAAVVFGLLALLAAGQALALFGRSRFGQSRSSWIGFALSGLASLLFLFAGVVTASRAGVVLTLAALLLLLFTARSSHASRRIAWPWLAALVLFVAAGAWVGGSLGLLLMERFSLPQADSFDRALIWRHYWRLAQAAPLFGYGLGSFTDANLAHLNTVKDAVFLSYIHAAHNHGLQLLLAGGWPFLVLHLAAGSLITARTVRNRRPDFDPRARALWLGLLVVLGGSMVDIALTVPAIVTLCAVILGLLWGRAIRRSSDRAERAPPDL